MARGGVGVGFGREGHIKTCLRFYDAPFRVKTSFKFLKEVAV
jgi:hypothetical protein